VVEYLEASRREGPEVPTLGEWYERETRGEEGETGARGDFS
jgi:hypothetical protein